MSLENEGPSAPNPGSAIEVAMWRGGVNEKLRAQGEFIKDIDHSVTALDTKLDLKHDVLSEKITDIKATVSKFVIIGGCVMFVLQIIILIAVPVIVKYFTKGM